MADVGRIVVKIRVSWWLRMYLRGLVIFCRLHGTEPNWEKVQAKVKAGVRVSVPPR
jgi:hypothetical protein